MKQIENLTRSTQKNAEGNLKSSAYTVTRRGAHLIAQDALNLGKRTLDTTLGISTYLASELLFYTSLPIVGNLNTSLRERIYVKTSGEEDDFTAKMHGSSMSQFAGFTSCVLNPLLYGCIGRITGDQGDALLYGFVGCAETVARAIYSHEIAHNRTLPGSLCGVVLGTCVESTHDYLVATYQRVRDEFK